MPSKKITKTDITTEIQLTDILIKTSKENPTKIITAFCSLGTVRIYINDHQPQTDTPDGVQTFESNGGFFKNGKIVKPTKTFMKRHLFIPVSR